MNKYIKKIVESIFDDEDFENPEDDIINTITSRFDNDISNAKIGDIISYENKDYIIDKTYNEKSIGLVYDRDDYTIDIVCPTLIGKHESLWKDKLGNNIYNCTFKLAITIANKYRKKFKEKWDIATPKDLITIYKTNSDILEKVSNINNLQLFARIELYYYYWVKEKSAFSNDYRDVYINIKSDVTKLWSGYNLRNKYNFCLLVFHLPIHYKKMKTEYLGEN